jgi:UDP-N-acetylglucosamine transferase subunit ALG13
VIFVTVGHQMPFDRLVRAVDQWAGSCGRADVFAQIGAAVYQPRNIQCAANLPPEEFSERIQRAEAIVSHAGTGTIIAALRHRKPLLVLPRRSDLGETRNDHQLATARRFAERGAILVADDETDLLSKLERLRSFNPSSSVTDCASPQLIKRIREFVFDAAQHSP